jgi:hypothetical protein
MPGYEDCVRVKTAARKSNSFDDLIEWLGDWDPETFHLSKISKKFNK